MNNSVTEKDIQQLLDTAEISVEKKFDRVTVVVCKLANGFVITEASGAVAPANYSEEIGREVCVERIKNKLWELEGYKLQCKIYEEMN